MRRLPLRRRIKPMRQGDLDGLCGVYAIVNAIRWLCPTLSNSQSQELFNVLIDARERRPAKRPLAFIYSGINRIGLSRLIEAATGWALNLLDISIEAEWLAPPRRNNEGPTLVWAKLQRHIGSNSIAILGLGLASEHWTVAVQATTRQLTLLDSDGMSSLRQDSCLRRRDGVAHYELQLRDILVLRRHSKCMHEWKF